MSNLEKAIEIAAVAHSGQLLKNGLPYILHPLHVMATVKTVDEKIVAVLHDVVEDTPVTLNTLRDNNSHAGEILKTESLWMF